MTAQQMEINERKEEFQWTKGTKSGKKLTKQGLACLKNRIRSALGNGGIDPDWRISMAQEAGVSLGTVGFYIGKVQEEINHKYALSNNSHAREVILALDPAYFSKGGDKSAKEQPTGPSFVVDGEVRRQVQEKPGITFSPPGPHVPVYPRPDCTEPGDAPDFYVMPSVPPDGSEVPFPKSTVLIVEDAATPESESRHSEPAEESPAPPKRDFYREGRTLGSLVAIERAATIKAGHQVSPFPPQPDNPGETSTDRSAFFKGYKDGFKAEFNLEK